jgi:hypothetical protein
MTGWGLRQQDGAFRQKGCDAHSCVIQITALEPLGTHYENEIQFHLQ